MKQAIALAGGGTKGAYQVGAWKAMRALGIPFDIVTGTSIGSVTAALMVQGDFDRAEEEYRALDEAVHALFEEGNPVGAKCALSVMGKIGPTMRLPLVEGSQALREKFSRLIAEYDLR